jgi:acyl-CoA synthetase (AMP-forming)/AMP-acid ligase II/acyl carrier protein
MKSINPVADIDHLTISGLLGIQQEVYSNHVAVQSPQQSALTYKALYQQVEKTSSVLRQAGLGCDDRIAVVLANGADMAVTVLAVCSVGACAPLNPAYQPRELKFYFEDLGVKAIIVAKDDPTAASKVAEEMGLIIFEVISNADTSGVFTLSTTSSSDHVDKEVPTFSHTALLLHTSGTTSRPKLVPLTQHNLLTSAMNIATTLKLTPEDCCLNMMPLFHIHGLVAALLATLISGGSIICTAGYRESEFFDWLIALQPSWYSAVPTIHQSILENAESHQDAIRNNRLRFARSSSAAMPVQVMEKIESLFSIPLIEAYGMTEAAHQMASNPLPPAKRKPKSVGLAAGPEVGIMNSEGELLPTGSSGEIVIRGANVTTGYENNPEANAENFSNGWFRTGDQGKLDEEGYLFLSDRLKEIINRGGEKVSPREVDEAIMQHPDIIQAVTFALKHDSLGEDVAAAVIMQKNATTTASDIREFLFGRLTDFKIPSVIIVVDEIPKGSTGKLQRIGLADKLGDSLDMEYERPDTEIEKYIASLWQDILNIDRVGRQDNFFILGGDSLRATQVITRIQNHYLIHINVVLVFEKPTLRELSRFIEQTVQAQQSKRLEGMLDELDSLTDDTAESMLSMTIKPRKRS